MSVHICETTIDAVVIERQFLMIDSEQVQNGGVKVVNRHRVLTREIAHFVGRPVTETFFHARTSQETDSSG